MLYLKFLIILKANHTMIITIRATFRLVWHTDLTVNDIFVALALKGLKVKTTAILPPKDAQKRVLIEDLLYTWCIMYRKGTYITLTIL